ncbi:MAG: M67 family metallopeptidase [Symploca sp. SIO1B1]|nr:M67 family metallopeptidase [Symploca sp. SIO1C2]NER47454.1 M67 family metallopeptidase [Symploca sp. SIO1A3]NER96208.1 M67 family metallopeptidase [Symploca sp. SIO1B1]
MLKSHTNQLQTIKTHAESTYPEECCGILIGHQQDEEKTLIEVFPTENSWNNEAADIFSSRETIAQSKTSRRNRFTIAPAVMLQAQKNARNRQLDIIGIYHSHPDYPAVPSEFDRAIAWQQYSYIIVSVQLGVASELNSWILDEEHQFHPEDIMPNPG